MKILLIQQELGRRNREQLIYPIGLAYLAASLVKNHRVKIFDPNLFNLKDSLHKLCNEIEAFDPDLVGLSIKYIDTTQRRDPFIYYNTVGGMIEAIKEIKPKAYVVVGGSGFSMFAKEIMQDIEDIDFGIYLEGEDSFPELLDNLDSPQKVKGIFFRKTQSIYFTGERERPDFKRFLWPIKEPEVIDLAKYITNDYRTFGIQTKRGCIFGCVYCNYPFLNGNKLRLRDPLRVVDEIEFMVKTYNLRCFFFSDNIFNIPQNHALEISLEIIKRKLDVKWGAWFSLKNFSQELLDIVREAGCRYIEFSPDGATKQALDFFKKRIDLNDIEASLGLIKKTKNITVAYNFFCVYPVQNLNQIFKTIFLITKIFVILWGRVRIGLSWIRILPHTLIYRVAIQEKIIKKDTNLLAKDKKNLKKLFYTKPSLWYADIFFNCLLITADYLIKPLLKYIFKLFNKIYPFYYS